MSPSPILYIEDEEDYQLLVRRILGRAGLDVAVAGTGREGLEALRQERPSMLILDINLPDTDGYAICAQLRQDPAWQDLPILMLTVRRRPEEWLRGFASGANDYISKPLNPPELIERAVNCLEGKAQRLNHKAPEYQLIQAAVSGNRAAFEVLIQKYKERLVSSIGQTLRNAAEADDIVSQAFVTAFEQLGRFRGEASFYTWLYRIAVNESIAQGRRSQGISLEEITQGDETHLPSALAQKDPTPDGLLEATPSDQVRQVLDLLEQPYRKMLEYYFLKDLSYEQIAQKMDLPIGTVMSRLHRARLLLKEAWEKKSAGAAAIQ